MASLMTLCSKDTAMIDVFTPDVYQLPDIFIPVKSSSLSKFPFQSFVARRGYEVLLQLATLHEWTGGESCCCVSAGLVVVCGHSCDVSCFGFPQERNVVYK